MKKLLALGLLALVSMASCGDSASTGPSVEESQVSKVTEEKPPPEPPEVAHPEDWTALKRVAAPYAKRLLIPHGPPPKHVVIRVLREGQGPALRKGDDFLARYVSFTYDDGLAAEPYWHSPSTYTFEWGGYRKGWEIGLGGLRVGDTRELIVPSPLAYGNGARVYVVQALKLS
jgi:hypothetical protein